jgi:hypothetical protein
MRPNSEFKCKTADSGTAQFQNSSCLKFYRFAGVFPFGRGNFKSGPDVFLIPPILPIINQD